MTCADATFVTATATTAGNCVWYDAASKAVTLFATGSTACDVKSKTCADATVVTATATTAGNCVWYDAASKAIVLSVGVTAPCFYQMPLAQYIAGYILMTGAVLPQLKLQIENGVVGEGGPTFNVGAASGLVALQQAVWVLSDDITVHVATLSGGPCTMELLGTVTTLPIPFTTWMSNVADCCLDMTAAFGGSDNGHELYTECHKYACQGHLSTNVLEFSTNAYWGTIAC